MMRNGLLIPLALLASFGVACGEEPGDDLTKPDAGGADAGPADGGGTDGGPTDGGPNGTRDGGFQAPVDDRAPYFEPDRLLDVAIELDPDDWEFLRNQARDISDLFAGTECVDSPPLSPYLYVPARVTIDGETVEQVGVRKKGFFGSVNPVKPSLKVKFDEYVVDQKFSGFERMTFNNGRQGGERSFVRQCVGYRLFSAAGIAAPRCNYARITVNGEAYGVFVHVESVKKDFLRQHFDDDEGALYEGALSDFRPVFIGTFERKTNKEITDRTDLDGVAAALELPDDQLLSALGDLIDVDEFITFWALENLILHWDGYTGRNNNNFFIYNYPATGRFHFIPWGIDAIMGYGPGDAAEPVLARSLLARRLYEHPITQAQYVTRMFDLLDTVWDEIELLTMIRETETLIRPHMHNNDLAGFESGLVSLRRFVQERRAAIDLTLGGTPPIVSVPLSEPICLAPIGELSGSFETTWGTFPTNQPFMTGAGTFTATVGGNAFVGETVSSAAGVNQDGVAVVQVPATFADGSITAVIMYMTPDLVRAGNTVPLEVAGGSGGSLFYIAEPGSPVQTVGQIGMGTITFTAASTAQGDVVTGYFSGTIFEGL